MTKIKTFFKRLLCFDTVKSGPPKTMTFFSEVALPQNTKKWPPAFFAPGLPFCKAITGAAQSVFQSPTLKHNQKKMRFCKKRPAQLPRLRKLRSAHFHSKTEKSNCSQIFFGVPLSKFTILRVLVCDIIYLRSNEEICRHKHSCFNCHLEGLPLIYQVNGAHRRQQDRAALNNNTAMHMGKHLTYYKLNL